MIIRQIRDLPFWNSAIRGVIGFRISGTLGDIDPLNKVPLKRAISRVKKGLLEGVYLMLPRMSARQRPKEFGSKYARSPESRQYPSTPKP